MHVTEFDHASINFDCHRTFRPATISNLTVPRHSATATSQPSLGIQQDFRVVLQGLVIDVVDQCTTRPLQANGKHHNVDMASGAGMFAWHHEVMHIAQSPRYDLVSELSEDDAFWITLVVDRNPLGGSAPQSFNDEYPQVLDYLQLLEHQDYNAMKVTTNPIAKQLETFSNDSVSVDTWMQATFQRYFFSTQRGPMRLIPDAALQGDLIAIFLGAGTPFVLGKSDARVHVVVGECYIHRIMNGEALQDKEADLMDIVLQYVDRNLKIGLIEWASRCAQGLIGTVHKRPEKDFYSTYRDRKNCLMASCFQDLVRTLMSNVTVSLT